MNPEIQQKIPENTKPKENFLKEIVKFTLIALAIVVPIRTYIAQPFIVSGASMDPTFQSGEYLIIDQLTYHFNEPQRGDVVIFRYPRDPSTFFIKRIIGLPGEKISMNNGIITIINKDNPKGIILPDSHISDTRKSLDTLSVTLGSTEYFVMGDNRRESSDSRVWGPLERKYIIGRPAVSLIPISKAEIFPGR
jgi:signal peptidase I